MASRARAWHPGCMKTPLQWFLVACLLFVAACGGAASAAGVYQLDTAAFRDAMAEAMKDVPEDLRQEQLDAMIAGMSGSFDLKADGTHTFKMAAMGQSHETSGTWKVDGGTITITAKGPDGKDEPKTGKYAAGVITLPQDQGGKEMALVFRRK